MNEKEKLSFLLERLMKTAGREEGSWDNDFERGMDHGEIEFAVNLLGDLAKKMAEKG